MIVNELADATVHDVDSGILADITDTVGPAPYFDVNGDDRITAADAVQVINEIARRDTSDPEAFDLALLDLDDE